MRMSVRRTPYARPAVSLRQRRCTTAKSRLSVGGRFRPKRCFAIWAWTSSAPSPPRTPRRRSSLRFSCHAHPSAALVQRGSRGSSRAWATRPRAWLSTEAALPTPEASPPGPGPILRAGSVHTIDGWGSTRDHDRPPRGGSFCTCHAVPRQFVSAAGVPCAGGAQDQPAQARPRQMQAMGFVALPVLSCARPGRSGTGLSVRLQTGDDPSQRRGARAGSMRGTTRRGSHARFWVSACAACADAKRGARCCTALSRQLGVCASGVPDAGARSPLPGEPDVNEARRVWATARRDVCERRGRVSWCVHAGEARPRKKKQRKSG